MEIYLGFDPGFTTGFARGVYDVDENTLTVTDLAPIALNTRHPTINMANPPITCFGDFWGRVSDIFGDAYDSAIELDGPLPSDVNLEGAPTLVHTAIEDFVGGAGGDIQNTVNKLIGVIMAVVFDQDEARVSEPKVFRNKSRVKYLPVVHEKLKGRTDVSPHSKDALAHLLHRLFQEHSENFADLKIVVTYVSA